MPCFSSTDINTNDIKRKATGRLKRSGSFYATHPTRISAAHSLASRFGTGRSCISALFCEIERTGKIKRTCATAWTACCLFKESRLINQVRSPENSLLSA
jgi:hypothetical protein